MKMKMKFSVTEIWNRTSGWGSRFKTGKE